MAIELKHLRYTEVAERCGSFRKAADLLALKQSNLSRRVRHLEEQLGVALFERTNGGVRPTSAGQDFINGVRRVLNELQIVIDGAKAVGRGEAGYLTIGFYTSLSAGNLRASLVEYGRRWRSMVTATEARWGSNRSLPISMTATSARAMAAAGASPRCIRSSRARRISASTDSIRVTTRHARPSPKPSTRLWTFHRSSPKQSSRPSRRR